jgi:hypothetical protein
LGLFGPLAKILVLLLISCQLLECFVCCLAMEKGVVIVHMHVHGACETTIKKQRRGWVRRGDCCAWKPAFVQHITEENVWRIVATRQ